MRKIVCVLCGVLFFHTQLSCLLPPLYQGIQELKDILNDPKLGELLQSGEVIEEIKKDDKGYLIVTNKNTLLAEVVYLPANRPGPARYQIILHEPIKPSLRG